MTTVLRPGPDRVMRYARIVFGIIAVGSAVTVAAAAVLQQVDPDQVNWVVWVRAGFYTVGGLWLLAVVRDARQKAARTAFTRLRVICVLAPLGIAALVIAPDSGYPLWMRIEQACFGILMAPLAVALFKPSVAADFRRARQAGNDRAA
ncbi:hypothetical protein [Actinomadura montaniterrae]|uniref:Uncharacterized protein n=1 Tax=Actinomadura montaniterrae TaxID=1803903 RepID=A0A6L3W6Q0_9ACTN|nr:hypothetical protein [Actinomadura montaniterrae]KAB2390470.1 hypothetical protein F9B16_01165 [Actinomadura montaniterrae]